MPLGRPRTHLDDAQRAEARRAKVRANVQAFRRRQKEKALLGKDKSRGSISPVISITGRTDSGDCSRKSSTNVVQATTEPASPVELTFEDPSPLSLSPGVSSEATDRSDSRSPSFSPSSSASFSPPFLPTLLPSLPSSLPQELNVNQTYQDGFIATLQHHYLPESPIPASLQFVPGARMALCCSNWLSTAYTLTDTQGSDLLRSALLASALNFIGHEMHDKRLVLSGFQAQTKAIHQLRKAFDMFLEDNTQCDPALLAMTVTVCAMSELIVNKSWDNYRCHLQGVGALIERGGPESLREPLLKDCATSDLFYGYRSMQAPFCFITRRTCFLARPEWIDLAWRKTGPDSDDHMQKMLDIAYQIPGEMQDYDQSVSNSPQELRERIRRLRKLALRLDQWKEDMDSSCSEPPYQTKVAAWPGLYDEAIFFGNVVIAMPFTKSCGVRIYLYDLIRTIAEELTQHDNSAHMMVYAALSEALKWANLACRCLEYFHSEIKNFKVIGKVVSLFPFDAAWDIFTKASELYGMDMHRELSWCQETAERYAAIGLPVLKWR